MFEPLTIAIVLPLNISYPWCSKGSKFVGALEGQLRSVWQDMPERSGTILLQFFSKSRSLESLSKGVVRKVLQKAPQRSVPNCRPGKRRRVSVGKAPG